MPEQNSANSSGMIIAIVAIVAIALLIFLAMQGLRMNDQDTAGDHLPVPSSLGDVMSQPSAY